MYRSKILRNPRRHTSDLAKHVGWALQRPGRIPLSALHLNGDYHDQIRRLSTYLLQETTSLSRQRRQSGKQFLVEDYFRSASAKSLPPKASTSERISYQATSSKLHQRARGLRNTTTGKAETAYPAVPHVELSVSIILSLPTSLSLLLPLHSFAYCHTTLLPRDRPLTPLHRPARLPPAIRSQPRWPRIKIRRGTRAIECRMKAAPLERAKFWEGNMWIRYATDHMVISPASDIVADA